MTIRLKVRDDSGDVEQFLIEDRRDIGPEIQHSDAPLMDAGTSATVDVYAGHCPRCWESRDDCIGERLGLTLDEIRIIRRWRTRKEDGVSPGELGRVLDKLCARLDDNEDCERDTVRIVLEVEPTP